MTFKVNAALFIEADSVDGAWDKILAMSRGEMGDLPLALFGKPVECEDAVAGLGAVRAVAE